MAFPYGERLRAALGPARPVERLTSSPRSNVWRARLDGSLVVVKQVIGGPDAAVRYEREVTALRLAAHTGVTPVLLGADPATLTLVLAYVEDEGPPENWVVAYAEGLARLHATRVSADALPGWAPPGSGDVRAFVGFAGMLGIDAGPVVEGELAALLSRLASVPGDALLHGDPCPGNDLYVSGEVRFVDLEGAARGPGVMELAYLRVGFPTCWCVTSVPPALLRQAEGAYLDEWRALRGTPPPGDLTDACVGWSIRGDALVQKARRGRADQLAGAFERDWKWGTVTARQRLLHRLRVVADLTETRPDLTAVNDLAISLRKRMLELWPALTPPPRRRP